MIVLEVTEKGGALQRYELDDLDVQVGAATLNHLVLPGTGVSERHARFVERDDRLIVVDLKSESGVYVNGRRITSPLVIRPADRMTIGDYTVRGGILPPWPDDADVTPIVEAVELRLLDGIAQGDDVSRLVYADWLDEHGRPDRAEWLRLVASYDGEREAVFPRLDEIRNRLLELATTIEVRWRLRVARPRIVNCSEACPRVWEALAVTNRRHVRACSRCNRSVYYCGASADAIAHDAFGDRVAVDFYALPDDWSRLR